MVSQIKTAPKCKHGENVHNIFSFLGEPSKLLLRYFYYGHLCVILKINDSANLLDSVFIIMISLKALLLSRPNLEQFHCGLSL